MIDSCIPSLMNNLFVTKILIGNLFGNYFYYLYQLSADPIITPGNPSSNITNSWIAILQIIVSNFRLSFFEIVRLTLRNLFKLGKLGYNEYLKNISSDKQFQFGKVDIFSF